MTHQQRMRFIAQIWQQLKTKRQSLPGAGTDSAFSRGDACLTHEITELNMVLGIWHNPSKSLTSDKRSPEAEHEGGGGQGKVRDSAKATQDDVSVQDQTRTVVEMGNMLLSIALVGPGGERGERGEAVTQTKGVAGMEVDVQGADNADFPPFTLPSLPSGKDGKHGSVKGGKVGEAQESTDATDETRVVSGGMCAAVAPAVGVSAELEQPAGPRRILYRRSPSSAEVDEEDSTVEVDGEGSISELGEEAAVPHVGRVRGRESVSPPRVVKAPRICECVCVRARVRVQTCA